VAWGIDFDGTAAAAPIKVELIDTDVAATVTAHVASGLVKLNGPERRGVGDDAGHQRDRLHGHR
jgi:hypothetical protein